MLYNVYFSARGTTKRCADTVAKGMKMDMVSFNWLDPKQRSALKLGVEDMLLLSMPVYAGVIPQFCAELTELLSGNETPAVVCAVYGNRHYDHALLQMQDLLTANGLQVIAAGAFVAAHSIFPKAASGRPDADDCSAMEAFGAACAAMLQKKAAGTLRLPGDPNYDPAVFKRAHFQPAADDRCVACGQCAEICPVGAINPDTVRTAREDCCLSCGACIEVCPTGARNYRGAEYEAMQDGFAERCSAYRKPEVFYAE